MNFTRGHIDSVLADIHGARGLGYEVGSTVTDGTMGAKTGDSAGQWVAQLDRTDPAVRFVRVAGRLDQRGAPELRRLIDDQLAKSPERFLLDLSGVSTLDSGGARSLVGATEYAAELKVDLCVVASNGVAGALRAAAAPHVLALHGSLDEALEQHAE